MHPQAVELTASRTAHAKHYQNPDGTFSGVFSTGPIHYQDTVGGPWKDKVQRFVAGAANEWVSNQSDVSMRTFQVGTGGNRRWWVEFKETLTGRGIRFELQFQPTPVTDTNELRFTDAQSRSWSYFHTRSGGKMLGPQIPSAEGPKTFSFNYELLGGVPALVREADGSISCGDVFKMAAPHLEGADGLRYAYSAWTIDSVAQTLSFSYTDVGLPLSAFPYQVDPSTTFNIAASLDDQQVARTGTTYPPTGTIGWTPASANAEAARSLGSGATYAIRNMLLKWDTSGVIVAPDVVISATLRIVPTATRSVNTRNFTLDWGVWDGTSASDYSETPLTDALLAQPISGLTANVDNDIVLDNVDGIDVSGITYLRGHIDGGQPTGDNYLLIAAWDHATLTEARLVVDYGPPPPYIQLDADGTGKKKRTQTLTVASNILHTGYDIRVGETGNRAAVLNAAPSSADYGLLTRNAPQARDQRFYQVLGLTGNTTEALQTLTPTSNFVTGSTGTTFTVTAGKTLFVEHLGIHNRSDAATAFWARANLRVNTAGTATASSPIALSATLPYRSVAAAAAGFGSFDEVWYPGGVYIPAGASFGISYVSSSGTAARLKVDIFLVGFEF